MSIKDILVHLDGDSHDAAALAVAVEQARRFGARLTGLFARKEVSAAAVVARRASESLLAAADAARAGFDAAVQTAGLDSAWWTVQHGGPNDLTQEVVFCCHYADLVVVSQAAAQGSHVPADMIEQMIYKSGRPVLVVPSSGGYTTVGRRVMLGWRPGQEAARALHDALPLMAGAETVVVASVGAHVPMGAEMPKVDVLDHLRRHGLPVTGERIHVEDLGVMDALLSRAYDHDADLLVMGAHAAGGLSLGRTGTGTRYVLGHMSLPVLFAC